MVPGTSCLNKQCLHAKDEEVSWQWIVLLIICSLGEEPVKITEEASRDKFQMRFKKKRASEN